MRWYVGGPGAAGVNACTQLQLQKWHLHAPAYVCSNKRVKGRSHAVEERISMHPHKPHEYGTGWYQRTIAFLTHAHVQPHYTTTTAHVYVYVNKHVSGECPMEHKGPVALRTL